MKNKARDKKLLAVRKRPTHIKENHIIIAVVGSI
jgi:hypothetical protein